MTFKGQSRDGEPDDAAAFDRQDPPPPRAGGRRGAAAAFVIGFACGVGADALFFDVKSMDTALPERAWSDVAAWFGPPSASPDPGPSVAVPVPVPVPEHGDWSVLSEAQRTAAARSFGYDGEVRDGKFARWLAERPTQRAEFERRFMPAATAATSPAPPVAVADPAPEPGDWSALNEAQRTAAARSFGYDGEVRDGKFARWLAERPTLRAEFERRFMPATTTTATLSAPPVAVLEHGDWSALSEAQRTAAARSFGYDGEVRDGKFARWLAERPTLRAEFERRFTPATTTAAATSPAPPVAVADPVPEHGDWSALSEAQRTAAARSFGYDGKVRDGKFARWLAERPTLRAEFERRFTPTARSTASVAPSPPPSSAPAPSPPSPPPARAGAAPAPPSSAPAPIKPAPIKPAPPPLASPPAATKIAGATAHGAGGFAVQVGTFQDRANAEALIRRLASRGRQAYAADWTDGRGRTWRVVRVGNFPSAAAARQAAQELAAAGAPGQVVSAR